MPQEESKGACQVCGHESALYRCGAIVCEACKKFFLRNRYINISEIVCNQFSNSEDLNSTTSDVTSEERALSPATSECVVTSTSRSCKKCRLARCYSIGMTMKTQKHSPGKSVCYVCGIPAIGGSHVFNTFLSCESCKGFFRRSEKDGRSNAFKCSRFPNQQWGTFTPCNITGGRSKNSGSESEETEKRKCKLCRFMKCLDCGMVSTHSPTNNNPSSKALKIAPSTSPPPHHTSVSLSTADDNAVSVIYPITPPRTMTIDSCDRFTPSEFRGRKGSDGIDSISSFFSNTSPSFWLDSPVSPQAFHLPFKRDGFHDLQGVNDMMFKSSSSVFNFARNFNIDGPMDGADSIGALAKLCDATVSAMPILAGLVKDSPGLIRISMCDRVKLFQNYIVCCISMYKARQPDNAESAQIVGIGEDASSQVLVKSLPGYHQIRNATCQITKNIEESNLDHIEFGFLTSLVYFDLETNLQDPETVRNVRTDYVDMLAAHLSRKFPNRNPSARVNEIVDRELKIKSLNRFLTKCIRESPGILAFQRGRAKKTELTDHFFDGSKSSMENPELRIQNHSRSTPEAPISSNLSSMLQIDFGLRC